jgi:hypothetical protein
MESFEDQYLDVLQNIESAIVGVYRQQPDLTDYDVDNALNALIRAYRFEQQNQTVSPPQLNPLATQVYIGVKLMCEWRLGRQKLFESTVDGEIPSPPPKTMDEIIACLKRIRKSVERWNKRGGTRGYLQYIIQFTPYV